MSTTTANREKSSLGTFSTADIPVRMLPTVELSVEQLQEVSVLAEKRNESYHQIDGGELFGKNNSLTNHQIGLIGELAVAKAYQTELDEEIYKYGDDGKDLTLWGKSIDIKTTSTWMKRPQLLVRTDEELSADLYFLVHLFNWGDSGARVRLQGYATRDRVKNREPREHPGHRMNYVVPAGELTPPPWVRNA